MALDNTAFASVYKTHYVKKRIYRLADHKKRPFWGCIDRNTKAGGDGIKQAFDFDNPGGGSATFATARTNATASQYTHATLTRKANYQFAFISNETIEASNGTENAFLKAMSETDKALKQAGIVRAGQMFRTAGASIGAIHADTTLASTTLKLTDKADAFNFQVGMVLVLNDTDDGTSVRSGTLTVAGVNRAAGTIETTANISTGVAAAVLGDYVFREGDPGNGVAGLATWLPTTPPTAAEAALGNIDRSVDDRLYGVIRDASGGEALDETLQKLIADVSTMGGSPDVVYLNPNTLSNLLLIIGSKSRYEMVKMHGRAKIGFTGFTVCQGGEVVTLMADIGCPTNRMYVLTKKSWTWHSAGKAPMFLDRDGLLQRSTTADEYEIRIGDYSNMGSCAPCYNGVGKLA